MNPFRILLLAVGGWLLSFAPVDAQAPVVPFAWPKSCSFDMVTTTDEGTTVTMKIYRDNGKLRTEMNVNGQQIVQIFRPDQNKMYSVMDAQRKVMETPIDPEKSQKMIPGGDGDEVKFEVVVQDTIEGVACTKYKVTSSVNRGSGFLWVDAANHPVKSTMQVGTFAGVTIFKNYKEGAPDAALFEPPSDYQRVTLPAIK